MYSVMFLKMYENCSVGQLDELVTGDETCSCYFEPLRKVNKSWVPKGGDAPQIMRLCHSEKKVLYTVFFYSKGIVLQKPRKTGKEHYGEYYRDSVL